MDTAGPMAGFAVDLCVRVLCLRPGVVIGSVTGGTFRRADTCRRPLGRRQQLRKLGNGSERRGGRQRPTSAAPGGNEQAEEQSDTYAGENWAGNSFHSIPPFYPFGPAA